MKTRGSGVDGRAAAAEVARRPLRRDNARMPRTKPARSDAAPVAKTAGTPAGARPAPAKSPTGKLGTDKPLEGKPPAGERPAGKPPAGKAPAGKAPVGKAPAGKPRRARAMTLAEVRGFLEALARANPAPESELDYTDPYTLLVAVVLSAQATDASVNRATRTLFQDASTPAAMVRLGVEGVARHIRSIGLWQGKARNVVALSQALLDQHGGAVPADREALERLPGVGRKTANVVLNVAFGQATMAVDTHVFRLGNRTGIAPGATPRAVEDGLVRRVPKDLLRDAHHWLILHGRYVCKARRPECWRCVAAAWCRYPDKTVAPEGMAESDAATAPEPAG